MCAFCSSFVFCHYCTEQLYSCLKIGILLLQVIMGQTKARLPRKQYNNLKLLFFFYCMHSEFCYEAESLSLIYSIYCIISWKNVLFIELALY